MKCRRSEISELRSFQNVLSLFIAFRIFSILQIRVFPSLLFFEGGCIYTHMTWFCKKKEKRKKVQLLDLKTVIVKHSEVKPHTEDLISVPFVICIDYKSNQSCIVLSSMSTQQLMTLPGIILFKCYFQFKSAC